MSFVDTHTDAPAGRPTPWWRYALIGLAGLLVLLGTAALVLKYLGVRELRAARAEYEKLKLPASMEAIIKAVPAIRDEENMALAIVEPAMAIDARMTGLRESGRPCPDLALYGSGRAYPILRHGSEPWTPGERAALQRFANVNANELQQMIDAASRPEGRFHVEWVDPPINMVLPHLIPARSAVCALALEAVAAGQRGDGAHATKSLKAMARTNRSLDKPKLFLITQLTQFSIAVLVTDAAEEVFAVCEPPDAALRELQQALEPDGDIRAIREVAAAECVGHMDTIRGIYSGKQNIAQFAGLTNAAAPNLPLHLAPGMREHDIAAMMRLTSDWLNVLEQPTSGVAMIQQSQLLEAQVAALPRTCVVTRLLMPSMSRAIMLLLRGVASSRATMVAIAAERYRMRHGDWPAALGDLAPEFLAELQVDPFTNEPLKYVRDARGIVVYSVGEDGVDSSGEVMVPVSQRAQGARWQPRDVGIRLLHAPLRRPEAALQTH